MAKSKLPDLVKKFESGEIDYDKLEAEYATKKAEQEAKGKQAEMPGERKVAADPSPVSTAGKIRLSF